MLRILHLSDSHGHMFELPPEDTYDVIIHSGDALPNRTRGQLPFEKRWQEDWLRINAEKIHKWIGNQPAYFCSGNHDFTEIGNILSDLGYVQLSERSVEYVHDGPGGDGHTYRMYGHSWTPLFTGEWHHELDADAEAICCESIIPAIENCDILVSHGPVRGILDTNSYGQHIGSYELKRAIQKCRRLPKVLLHGHCHESYSRKPHTLHSKVGKMKIYNSATGWNLVEVHKD